jgi:hypothetical protein
MTRKVIRCNNARPTPYLRKQFAAMLQAGYDPRNRTAIDIACGNGRNSRFLLEQGIADVLSLDMRADYDEAVEWLANKMIPAATCSASLVLCQYVMMFLTHDEELHLCAEINRVAGVGAVCIIELQEVKSALRCYVQIESVVRRLQLTTRGELTWRLIHQEKNRATLQLWAQR